MFGKIGISSSIEQLQNQTKPLQISRDTIHITRYKKSQTFTRSSDTIESCK